MKRNSLFWGIVDVALLIVLLRILGGCTRTVYVEKPQPTLYITVSDTPWEVCHQGYICTLAETVCSESNVPVVLLRKGAIPDGTLVFTKAHEETHVRQLAKDCRAIVGRYVDSLSVRVRMESEAYCNEGKERLKRLRDIAAVANWYTAMMGALYDTEGIVCRLKPP